MSCRKREIDLQRWAEKSGRCCVCGTTLLPDLCRDGHTPATDEGRNTTDIEQCQVSLSALYRIAIQKASPTTHAAHKKNEWVQRRGEPVPAHATLHEASAILTGLERLSKGEATRKCNLLHDVLDLTKHKTTRTPHVSTKQVGRVTSKRLWFTFSANLVLINSQVASLQVLHKDVGHVCAPTPHTSTPACS